MADTSSIETTDSSVDTPQWLFSFGASEVETSSNRKGHMKFIFNADNSSAVTAFTDRPDRLTDRLTMKKFVNSYDTIFGGGKPNASVTHWDMKGKFNNHAYEILGIKKKGNKYIVRTDLLQEDYIDEVAFDGDNNDSGAVGIPNPFSIAQANFFIDSAPWYCYSSLLTNYIDSGCSG